MHRKSTETTSRGLWLAAATLGLLTLLHGAPPAQAQPAELPARAFTNVTVHHADGRTESSATIVWRGNQIESVGRNVRIPFDARVTDGGDSLHVYPGFLNGYANWGAPARPTRLERPPVPGNPTYERAGIQPDRRPELHIESGAPIRHALRSGFTLAAIGLNGYMLPGQVSLFHLSDQDMRSRVYQPGIGQAFQFEWANGAYPSTLMGVMARLRQLFFDASALREHQQLYASATPARPVSIPMRDEVLESLYPVLSGDKPFFAVADDPEDIDRMLRLQRELGFRMVLVSGRGASARAAQLARAGVPVLVSLDVPEKPAFMQPARRNASADTTATVAEISPEMANFRERQEAAWRESMENIRVLRAAGVRVGISTGSLRPQDIRKKIDLLLDFGYTETELVSLMTTGTAAALGISARHGALTPGMTANIAVFNAPLADKKSKAVYTVSGGHLFNLNLME
jgi:hypothetical protein